MKTFDLYLLSRSFIPIYVVQRFTSFIWTSGYSSPGSFELYTPYSPELHQALNEGIFLYRSDTSQCGYIKTHVQKISSGLRMVIISGCVLEGIMEKRVFDVFSLGSNNPSLVSEGPLISILQTTLVPMLYPQASVDSLLSENPYWGMSNINFQANVIFSKFIYAALNYYDISLTHRVNPSNGSVQFYLWKGKDRTLSGGNDPLLISSKMSNIKNIEYQYSEEGCSNIILVQGSYPEECIGYSGTFCQIYNPENYDLDSLGTTHRLIERVSLTKEISVPLEGGGTQTLIVPDVEKTQEYFTQEAAAEYLPYAESFSAELLDPSLVSIGDLITYRDEERGFNYDKRVQKIVESYSPNGQQISVTFGDSIKTTQDVIRKNMGL